MNNLQTAYLRTEYQVYANDRIFSLYVGTKNSDFKKFCSDNNIKDWCIITAYNPYSQLCSDEENQQANANLLKVIKNKKKSFLSASGIPLNDSWKPEKSFFIINIDEIEALQLAKDFHQNAIIASCKDNDVKLLWV